MTKKVYQPSETTHWKTLFPSKMQLLGAHNLNENEELVAVITNVSRQEIKEQNGSAKEVPVLTFENAPPMALNITNAQAIGNMYGDSYTNWIGNPVQIYATLVKAFGNEGLALRIRSVIPDIGQDASHHEAALNSCTTMADLQTAFKKIPKHLKPRLTSVKDAMKEKLS